MKKYLFYLIMTCVVLKSNCQSKLYLDAIMQMGKDNVEAIRLFSKVIEDNPRDITSYVNRGISKSNLEDYRGAMSDFNKAIALDPTYLSSYEFRGETRFKQKDYKNAILDFDRVLILNPKYYVGYLNRAKAKYELFDYQGALIDLNKAIEFNSEYGEAYELRGDIKFKKLGDNIGAQDDYTNSIIYSFSKSSPFFKRGNLKSNLNLDFKGAKHDYQGGIEDYNKAIQSDPSYTEAYLNRGIAKGALENYHGAIDDYSVVIKIGSDNKNLVITAYLNRANIEIYLGQKDRACLDFSKAGELGYSYSYELIKRNCN
jgi:tetratricopeptide (TPR) repeat protein